MERAGEHPEASAVMGIRRGAGKEREGVVGREGLGLVRGMEEAVMEWEGRMAAAAGAASRMGRIDVEITMWGVKGCEKRDLLEARCARCNAGPLCVFGLNGY